MNAITTFADPTDLLSAHDAQQPRHSPSSGVHSFWPGTVMPPRLPGSVLPNSPAKSGGSGRSGAGGDTHRRNRWRRRSVSGQSSNFVPALGSAPS